MADALPVLSEAPERATSSPPAPVVAPSARRAMEWLVAERGFPHAVESLATAVTVEVVNHFPTTTYETRMAQTSLRVEMAVLDALVLVAQELGWRPPR